MILSMITQALDFNAVMQSISTIGFPIAMCLILMWYINKSNESHKEEMSKMSDALENNTLALTRLVAELDSLKFKSEDK